jgi:DNA adenine methylase
VKLNSPLKWHGGKHYLAKRIVSLMPPHIHYVEPFAGGLSVLLASNPEGRSEVVNDIHQELMNFWRVLQAEFTFRDFKRELEAIPFSEVEWEEAGIIEPGASPLRRAVKFFVRCRQSLAGRMDSFAPLSRTRTRSGMNEQVSAWLTAIDGLLEVHNRLKRVVNLCRPALDVIRQQDGPDTLFYCDPPYLHNTRSSVGQYKHEMTEEDHIELLDDLKVCQGKVIISGYPSLLYEKRLKGWTYKTFDLPNNAASGISKRRETETVWMNFKED